MKQMTRLFILLTLLLSMVVGVSAQSSVLHDQKKSLLGIDVHFRFDKAQLDLDYMGNAQSLDRFGHVIDSIGLSLIDSVIIVSQSSPEGVYEYNVQLSRRRASTMRQIIEQRHPELSDRLFVYPEGESCKRLRESVANDQKMKQTTIDQVLRIIDADINVATKKWRLQQLPIYRYLIQTHYPRLRNSVFCIVYFGGEIPVDSTQEVVVDKPQEVATDSIKVIPQDTVKVIPQVVPVDTLKKIPVQPKPLFYREPLLNVHTNLLFDLGTAVNVGVEYYPHNSRWTVAANYTFPWWGGEKKHRYLQLLDGELEVRRYFDKTAGHAGHYLMVYGHANLYDFSFDAERAWQGEGWGAGLGYGYVWQPWKDKRWKIEAFLRVGYFHSIYDPYHASEPYNGKYYYDWNGAIEDFERRNHRLRWIGPTGVGVTLSYDLLQRKLKK